MERRVKRIIDVVEWFEEFQPKDLEQIERIMLGLRYVNEEVVESELRQDIYNTISNKKLVKYLNVSYGFIDAIFRADSNERYTNKK